MPKYKNLSSACFLIALDNGGVNRERPASKVRKDISSFLRKTEYQDYLSAIDKWLGSLTDIDLDNVCTGFAEDIEKLLINAPPFTDMVLDTYFNEVC